MDGFIAKCSQNGEYECGIYGYHPSSGTSKGSCISVDENENIYLGGSFSKNIILGEDTLFNAGRAGYLAKYSPLGIASWAVMTNDQAVDITIDPLNNLYVLVDDQVHKFNNSGTPQWAHQMDNSPNCLCYTPGNKIHSAGMGRTCIRLSNGSGRR